MFYRPDGTPMVIRNFDYPISQRFSYAYTSNKTYCFASRNSKRPLKWVKLTPQGINGSVPFLVGYMNGDQRGALHDAQCKRQYLQVPGIKPIHTRYCGDRFNVKSGSLDDQSIKFKSNEQVFKFKLVLTKRGNVGQRFLVNTGT